MSNGGQIVDVRSVSDVKIYISSNLKTQTLQTVNQNGIEQDPMFVNSQLNNKHFDELIYRRSEINRF